MSMNERIRRLDRKVSMYRQGMRICLLEGIPAIILLQLLGGPFLTGYLLFLGASSEQIGLVLAVTTLVNAAQILMALAMQKITNRKWALVVCSGLHRLLWVSTGAIPWLVSPEWWVPAFIVLYFFAFLFSAGGVVVWSSLMGDLVPAAVRGKFFGKRNAILWALAGVSIFIGGQILERYPGAAGFQILFAICGVCAVLNIIAFMYYPDPEFAKSTEPQMSGMLKRPFRDAAFLKAMLFLSSFLLLQNVAVPFFNYVMLDVLKLSYSYVSMYTVIMTVVMMASYYVWGALNAKYSTQSLLLWTLPFIGLSCLVWGGSAFLPALLVIGLAHVLLGIGTGGFNLLAFNFIIGDTPKSERPMFIAVYSTLTGFAGFVGPLLGGFIYKKAVAWPLWVQQFGISAFVGGLLLACGFAGKYVFQRTGSKIVERGISS